MTAKYQQIGCFISFVVLLIHTVFLSDANARNIFDTVTDCDVLAAHPADTSRVAPSVAPDEVIPALAIKACEEALKDDKANARYALQLGRAWLQSGDTLQALVFFRQAADAGSDVALVYLGDAAQFGWVEKADTAKAIEFYRKAYKRGVEAAQAAIDQLTFNPSDFAVGGFLEHLVKMHQSAAADIAKDARARAYLFTFALELQATCGNILKSDSVSAMYIMRYPPDWDAVREQQDMGIGVQDFVASYDASIFYNKHGCNGVITKNLVDTMNTVFNDVTDSTR